MTRRTLIAANWKMHGLRGDLGFIGELDARLGAARPDAGILICPPATLLAEAASACAAHGFLAGGQDCAVADSGAFTGDLSAGMLRDAGASHVIVGHSERRAGHGETSVLVKAKAEAALRAGLTPVLCIGETLAERDAGRAEAVTGEQLAASWPARGVAKDIVVAYEPVWAIGTGRTASLADIAAMHAFIRAAAPGGGGAALRILYGGSVKPDNAAGILALDDVDGALVGGASLQAASFAAVISAAQSR